MPEVAKVEQLLSDTKLTYCVVLPSIHDLPINQYVWQYPLFSFYRNSTDDSALRFINRIDSTIEVREAATVEQV